MGADSQKRQRTHAKKLERARRRKTERRRERAQEAAALGPVLELDLQGPSFGLGERPKLSAILLDLAEPFLSEGERSLGEMQSAVTLAATVWNAAVLEREGRGSWALLLDSIRERMGDDAPALRHIAEAMREHIHARYATDDRTVMNWDVTPRGNTFYVNVLSMHGEQDSPAREGRRVESDAPSPAETPWRETFRASP